MDSCRPVPAPDVSQAYRRVFWIALAVNAVMFGVEAVRVGT